MAIKDWKQTRNNRMGFTFRNLKKGVELWSAKPIGGKNYVIGLRNVDNLELNHSLSNEFNVYPKTKQLALAYARQYMRTH